MFVPGLVHQSKFKIRWWPFSPWIRLSQGFTTLTTLGYGDITPLTPGVQSYAIMEAACGQIFLAVIIARLIALHITQERNAE